MFSGKHLRRRLGTPAILLLYALFALVITHPLVFHLTDSVVGDLESDVWKHVWGFWWVKESLLQRHVLPLYTSLLNYPYGGSLFFIDPLGSTLATPLQLFTSAATAYNVLVIFNLWLAAVGAFFLARYFCRSVPAAFVAGVVFGFSPYMLANITSGISESFNVGWIPLFILFYVRTLREPALSNAIWAGVLLAMSTIGCWYYGVFCVVFAALFTACWALEAGRRARVAVQWRRVVVVAGGLELLLAATQAYSAGPGTPDFWTCVGVGGAVLLALLGLGRRQGPRVRQVLRIVLPLDVALFSGWLLAVLGPRLGSSPDASAVALAATSAASLLVAVQMLLQRLPEGLASEVRRWIGMLIRLGGGAAVLAVSLRDWTDWMARPGTSEEAWVGIATLVLLWISYRMRDWEIAPGPRTVRPIQPRQLAACLLLSLAGLYLFAPPMPPQENLMAWTMGTLVLYVLAASRERAERLYARLSKRLSEAPGVGFYRTTFKRLLLMSLVAFVGIMPFAYAFKRTLNGELSLVYRVRNQANVDAHLSDDFQNISHLEDYVRPGKSSMRRTYTVDRLTRVSYAGWIALLLAAAGVRWGGGGPLGSGRRRWWWLAAGIAAVTFSLGPFLYVTADVHLGGRFPPYMWMYDNFPFFSQISIPYRFNMVAMLAVGVLGAYALAAWLRARPTWFGGLAAMSISLGVLLEVMLVSPAPYPLPLASVEAPAFARDLAAEHGSYGILDLPIQRYQGQLLPGEYFYYQVLHGKSIPNRVEGEIPIYVQRNAFMAHLFDLEHDWPGYPSQVETKLRESLQELRDYRFKYFVVHDNLLRPGARARVHALLSHFLGAPRTFDGNVHVYAVYGGAVAGQPAGGGGATRSDVAVPGAGHDARDALAERGARGR